MKYILLGINPVPWKAPSVAVINVKGRKVPKVYKDPELRNFQDAIKDAFAKFPDVEMLTDERLDIRFYFWRNAGTKHDHLSDVTNCQKALEDALQGILFPNDRAVVHADSWMMDQGPHVEARIVIEVSPAGAPPELTLEADDLISQPEAPATTDPTFDPKEYF